MEDERIIGLYFARSEQAIAETETKYGAYCRTVSAGILHNRQDEEECLNDTWLWIWNHIPPEHPRSLRAYLTRVVRNISFNRYRYLHAQKRDRNMECALDELTVCAPDEDPETDDAGLTAHINDFLRTQRRADRIAFVLRYFYGKSVKEIAADMDMKPKTVNKRLELTRERLRIWLCERGYRI